MPIRVPGGGGDSCFSTASILGLTLEQFELEIKQITFGKLANSPVHCFAMAMSQAVIFPQEWLGQCHDNVTEWDIKSWCLQPDL